MNIKYLILVGIGGSSLGAKAVYEALVKPEQRPLLLCADTVSPITRQWILAQIKNTPKEEILLNYVSKSGTTLESRENFEYFKDFAGEIVTTKYPPDVAGRFSVLTEVGLYPLNTLGFNTAELLRGKDKASSGNAPWLFDQLQSGMAVHDMFLFNPELESLGKWYRQLLGESTGKDGQGFVPTVSIGTNDLHSVFQRYAGGPKNIATTFVFGRRPGDQTMARIFEAVKKAYLKRNLPFTEYIMPEVNEFEIGKFLQTKMLEVIELARLMGVNPFDQPNVEDYKLALRP